MLKKSYPITESFRIVQYILEMGSDPTQPDSSILLTCSKKEVNPSLT